MWICAARRALQSASVPLPPLEGPPPLIGCSQCRKPMHLDCFVAHYNVVPARRDFTYCPAHVYVPKPKPPGVHKSHHKRERSSGAGDGAEKRKKKRRPERPPSPGELLCNLRVRTPSCAGTVGSWLNARNHGAALA